LLSDETYKNTRTENKNEMNELLTIPKEISTDYGRDYAWLRSQGRQYIENLSGKIWTDYNTHDPGITFLELMCYAITDLGYRMAMPVEDIVASAKNNEAEMHRQFLSALNVLPNAPVTANDYRKIFVRIDGVKNAWLTKHQSSMIANYKDQQPPLIRYAKPESEEPVAGKEFKFTLKGLYDILVEFEEFEEKDETVIADKKKEILKHVRMAYLYFRNLCEDVVDIREVPEQEVVLCSDIELEPKADPELVWANIAFAISQYLSPDINFYSLKEMQDKGKPSDEIFDGPVFDYGNIKLDQNDPHNVFTKRGFVDDEEVRNSSLRTNIRLSDIIRVINKVEGVKLIRSIAFAFCSCEETDPIKVAQLFDKDVWTLCIKPGHKPVLCLDNTVLNFYKDIIPIQLKETEARAKLDQINAEHKRKLEAESIEDLPMPLGSYRSIAQYSTMQNQLPETYGVGPFGLPDSVGMVRKAQVKQLKAYLFFFDQVLANYFSQLANVKTLLSADNSIAATYFSNVVSGLKDVDSIVPNWQTASADIMKVANLDHYPERKNQFLDHLLARFNEQFGDYVFLLHRLYGTDFDYAAINHKVNFYKDYKSVSTWRGSGYDYGNVRSAAEELVNISGMEKRVSRLLGFNHYQRQHIAGLPYSVYRLTPADSKSLYSWTIQKSAVDVLYGSGTSFNDVDAYEELGLNTIIASEVIPYRFTVNGDSTLSSFVVTDSSRNIIGQSPKDNAIAAGDISTNAFNTSNAVINKIIGSTAADVKFQLSADKKRVTFIIIDTATQEVWAKSPSWFAVLAGEEVSGNYTKAQAALNNIFAAVKVDFGYVLDNDGKHFSFYLKGTKKDVLLVSNKIFPITGAPIDNAVFTSTQSEIDLLADYFKNEFRLEGMYVVEHILLRPDSIDALPGEFMPVCIDPNGNYCRPLDPYSFRIDVILPGYSLRLRNRYFRQYAERIIRMETPAHILPRICFVDEAHMLEFETVYDEWRVAKRKSVQLNIPMDKTINTKLIEVLDNLFTIYDVGYLADCDDDTEDINPTVLGASYLGTLRSNGEGPQA
jgi:hypothetical protein